MSSPRQDTCTKHGETSGLQRQSHWRVCEKTKTGRPTKITSNHQMWRWRIGENVSIQIPDLDFLSEHRQVYDHKRWITMTMSRCDRADQQHVWLQIYIPPPEIEIVPSYCMIHTDLTYGYETWDLCPSRTIQCLNGANISILTKITNKSIQQEARATTSSLNLASVKHKS